MLGPAGARERSPAVSASRTPATQAGSCASDLVGREPLDALRLRGRVRTGRRMGRPNRRDPSPDMTKARARREVLPMTWAFVF